MTQKVLYFIAGAVPTAPELADIALLNARVEPQFEIGVRSNLADAEYGVDRLEPCDFVAGTVPAAFDDAEIPVLDPEDLPAEGIPEDGAVIIDGATVSVTRNNGTGGVNAVAIVADGEVTSVALPVSYGILPNANTVAVRNSAGANSVSGTSVVATTGVITGVNLPAANAVVANGIAIPITGGTVTLTIAAGVITGGAFVPE